MPPSPAPAEGPLLLLAAISARALAGSARRGGYRPVVLDCFADRDSQAAAERCRAVAAPGTLHFDRRALLAAAASLAPAAPLVYGSGFEARPALLTHLGKGRELVGNSPAVVRRVKDPRQFFPVLDALGIPHPEVRWARPDGGDGWLIKTAGGAGGTHVQPADARPPGAGDYFQRVQAGRSMSALFLADGRRALVLGFNEQWHSFARPGRPCLFGGAGSRVPMPEPVAAAVTERLQALVRETGLVGLNGLDFLLDGEHWWALEINPRPTATMELYDPDYPRGLVDRHILACQGELPRAAEPGPPRAFVIVEAEAEWRVPEAFAFPIWCRDIPCAGTLLHPGDPVCTVHGDADPPVTAILQARQREATLREMIRP